MKKITSKTITPEQIDRVNEYLGLGVDDRDLSAYAISYYRMVRLIEHIKE